MARNNNRSNDDNGAEIKILFIEAKNISSDLTGVAQAIASAFRPSPPPQMSSNPPRAIESKNGQLEAPSDDNEDDVIDVPVVPPAPKRQPRESKSFQGKPDDTINWDGNGTPFLSYFREKNPQETMKKYLVIAAWFKRHGDKEAIDNQIVYNAYRKLGSTVLTEIGQPFSDGVKSRYGYFTRKDRGWYAITGIGLDRVDDMGKAKSDAGT